jgi:hypothetical protein
MKYSEPFKVSLLSSLDPSQINCLNESSAHTLKSLLSSDPITTSDYLLSDADEQLLLNIPVSPPCKVIVFQS